MSYESNKNAHLSATQKHFLLDSMSLSGCQIHPIDANFHLQKKIWKVLIKIQLTKSDPKRRRGGKCPPSCQLGLKQQAKLKAGSQEVFKTDWTFAQLTSLQQILLLKVSKQYSSPSQLPYFCKYNALNWVQHIFFC